MKTRIRVAHSGSANQDCIIPDPGYRVYTLYLPLLNDDAKQLEVLEAGSENIGYRQCDFMNGYDCDAPAILVPLTDVFPTREAAISSLCPRVSHLWEQRVYGLTAALVDEILMTLGFRVYELLDTCPGIDPSDGT